MPRYPWSRTTPRSPRRLTWYAVITQLFTLIGRLVGRAATGGIGDDARTAPRRTTRRRG